MDDLGRYFDETEGFGVLATADGDGTVNTAVYARPHDSGDGRLAFIMTDRLTHANVSENPKASYLFREEGGGYRGKRILLTKVAEEEDAERIDSLRRRRGGCGSPSAGERLFLVHFRVDGVRPLVGDGADR